MNTTRQVKHKRSYDATTRQVAAEQNRQRILDVARKLFARSGVDRITVAQIAEQAQVASSTIYALFASKVGILRALMASAIFNPEYDHMVRTLEDVTDAVEQLRITARIARSIYEGEAKAVGLLRGVSAFSPELKKMEREFEDRRYELQQQRLSALFEQRRHRAGLSLQQARDIMWALTGRDLHRMLVGERRWSADAYEAWLADTLVRTLAA